MDRRPGRLRASRLRAGRIAFGGSREGVRNLEPVFQIEVVEED